MLVCNDRSGRKLFVRSSLVPNTLWPVTSPGTGSVASKLLEGGRSANPEPSEVDADDWIDHVDASRHTVMEHSIGMQEFVLSLLWWKDETQILDLDEDLGEPRDATASLTFRHRRSR